MRLRFSFCNAEQSFKIKSKFTKTTGENVVSPKQLCKVCFYFVFIVVRFF